MQKPIAFSLIIYDEYRSPIDANRCFDLHRCRSDVMPLDCPR